MIIIRIWHYKLLPYLPDAQFKGQLRELVAIMRAWRDDGRTNHLLINRVMEYDKAHLTSYFLRYRIEFQKRYHKEISYCEEFMSFSDLKYGNDFTVDFATGKIISVRVKRDIFPDWHTKEYLRMNMSNLAEKHFYGIGKSRITDEEWQRLCKGYKEITGEEYVI